MKQTIVVYCSKTGFTEKYAVWVAEALGCQAVAHNRMGSVDWSAYDTVIYGGGLTAGSVNGLKRFKKQAELAGKRLIVFATGAMPVKADGEEMVRRLRDGNLSEEERERIPFFYLQAGLSYEKMGLGSRILMKGMRSMLGKKADKTPEAAALLEGIRESFDCCSREGIEPLLETARK